ncbi:MAG TPA: flagellar basal-body MS-ring/collar protein FliF [Dongiaceae bacterium]|nr:flagellar basal-body MS-ring/collar protein FliF [Dongiaceae bacterium]
MEKALQQLLAFLRGLSLGQKAALAGSALLVAGVVWGFAYLLGGGDYKTLYSGMAPADAQSLAQRLTTQNIAYQISPDGTAVLVRSDQMDKARLEAASQPLASGRMGFELFDKPNWSGSDFSERVNYQRAVEAELERTIQTMNGVEGVRVHLVLPHESLFSDRQRPAKAAVVLKLRGARLNDAVTASVANLVSSAWDDLAPQNVSVTTTDGQSAGSGRAHSISGVASNEELETLLAERLVQTLTPIVGADHVKSSVTIDYDATSGETLQETYDPVTTAVVSSQLSQETVGDLEPAGIPGTPSNAPANQAAPTAAQQAKTSGTTQGIRSESKTFAVSKTTHKLVEPAGRIRRVAAAVLVDDVVESKVENGKSSETRRKRTLDEMKQIESLAKAAVGYDTKRGDLLSVENVAFATPPLEVAAPPGKLQRALLVVERWTNLLRYAAIGLLFLAVYFFLLRPVKQQVIRILQPAGTAGLLPAPGGSAGSAEGLARSTPASVEAAAPGVDVQQAVNLKKHLSEKVKADPEGASRLIRNWIREAEVKQ